MKAAIAPMRHATARELLFVAKFPTMGGEQILLLTDSLDDILVVNLHGDGKVALSFNMGAVMPDGNRLVRPRAISDGDWETLSRQPCYRDTLAAPQARGRDLCESLLGAHFSDRKHSRDVFVTTDDVGTGVDIFVRPWRGRLRRVGYLTPDGEEPEPGYGKHVVL